MKTINILLGMAGFVALCVLSFNYVEGHESTRLKNAQAMLTKTIERITHEANILNQDKIDVEGRLRRACSLLDAAGVVGVGDFCDEELEEGEKPDDMDSGSDSSDEPVESDIEKSEGDSDARN